jgi:hypothetical protein
MSRVEVFLFLSQTWSTLLLQLTYSSLYLLLHTVSTDLEALMHRSSTAPSPLPPFFFFFFFFFFFVKLFCKSP